MLRSRDWLFVALAALAGIVLSLFIGQFVLLRSSETRLGYYTDDLLTHSVNVAEASRSTLAELNADNRQPCSDTDLTEMRLLSFRSEYLRDLGRVIDAQIACTALWGRLKSPIPLPPPHRIQADGDRLWANAENIGEHRLKVDMVVRGTGVVFTSPLAFEIYERPERGLSARVATHDGKHIYRSFGDVSVLAKLSGRSALSPVLETGRIIAHCSEAVDICVTAGLSGINILRQPAPALLGIGGLGVLTGGSLALALLLRRRALSSLPQQIRRAIAENRLGVVYQPLLILRTGKVGGFETLVRLSDDKGDPISPDVFIKVAEQHGMIGMITRLVIAKALTEMQDRLLSNKRLYLGFNLSVTDILDPALLDYLDHEVTRRGLSSSQIVLEITERSTVEHEQLTESMTRFRAQGYEFFIDDFGTGYSSLAYLAKLPINGIKIDRMFTQAIGREAVSSAIVENICAMANRLGLALVAEGVETREQADYIFSLCPAAIGQGYLFGKPVPAAQIDTFLHVRPYLRKAG